MPVASPLKVLEAGWLGMRSARISAPREISWSAPQRNRVALSMHDVDVEAGPEPLFTHAFPQSCALAWILESLPCSGDGRRLDQRIAGRGNVAFDVSTWCCDSRGRAREVFPGEMPTWISKVGKISSWVRRQSRHSIAGREAAKAKTARWEGVMCPFEEQREERVLPQSYAGRVWKGGQGQALVFILRNFHLPFFARKK